MLLDAATLDDSTSRIVAIAISLTPEMTSAISQLMRKQNLIPVAGAATATPAFHTTIGLPGRLATQL